MNKSNIKLKGIISIFLLFSMIIPFVFSNSLYATERDVEIESIISDEKDSYDILIKFYSLNLGNDRKENAKNSQVEVIKLLEKGIEEGTVISYKSFYIVNGIHAIIKDKNLIRKIANFKNVEKITNNARVKKIEPIKNKRRRRSTIFVPDNRKIEWGVSQVYADKVWDEFGITGKGVTVGIIDTGVNYNLPAIKKNFKGYDEKTDSILDKSYYKDFISNIDVPEASSINDHGTHVTGTILGKEGEKLNQIGVAPGAKFISARALDDNGGDTARLLEAGEWMLEKKPDIINNSWGGTNDNDMWFKEMAQAWRDAGILPVFASGNSSSSDPNAGLGSISNPGNLLNVFSVGAIDRNKKIGDFSKKGPSAFDETKKVIKPDVVAPGVQVRSIDATGKYVSWNGTSMATPHVVGVAALLKEANPNLKPSEIEKIIRETAEPLKDNNFSVSPNMAYGYGLINAYDAVASIKGRKMGSVSGKVLKEGQDLEKSNIEFLTKDESYVGRNFKVDVKLTDDISIKEAKLFYKFNNENSFSELDFKLESGVQNNGIYTATIESENIKSGLLNLKVVVKDYADNITEKLKDINILDGIKLPWREDFESKLNGFILEGNWKTTGKVSSDEPDMVDGGKNYIGIDGGKPNFEKRVDSFIYLPPIDLSEIKKGEPVSLSMNDYKGFTGISLAKIQISTTGKENDWKDLYNVTIRPDITERKWEFNSYSLSEFAGEKNPILIRIYFMGHDSDSGVGWYIDNISLNKGDNYPPHKPKGLKAELDKKGLKISFKSVEVTDLKEYVLQRKVEGGEFTDLKKFSKDEKLEFVNNGIEKTYFKINYFDTDIQNGIKYIYRVKAVDLFENSSEWSSELEVTPTEYKSILYYDFEKNDGSFRKEQISGDTNDFEWGKPERPYGELKFDLKDVWDGLEPLSKMWGTNLNGKYSKNQDYYLLMPKFEIPNEEIYFYFDSFSTVSSVDANSFIVEIKDETGNWQTLFSREEVQSLKTLRSWQTLEKNLQDYKGKTVEVRFHLTSKNGLIFDEELGWYIDNIFVGSKKKVFNSVDENENYPIHIMNDASHNEVSGIPLGAKIEILETGKYTFSSEIDGSYRLGHSVNEKSKPYTLRVSSYGYEPIEVEVDLSTTSDITKDFKMKKAVPISFSGKVLDDEGNPLENAKVKVVEDENLVPVTTEKDGTYTFSNVFSGQYTVRFYKEGFESKEFKVKLSDNYKFEDVKLVSTSALKVDSIDYYTYPMAENGEYQTVHFNGSMKGNAVKFQSNYKNSILKNAEIFLVNNKYYTGKHIKVGVLGYDDEGRLVELAPFKEVENVLVNEWNVIDFTEYNIKRDKPLYIATRYEKPLSESAGVFYDVGLTETENKTSFIYDGAFIKTSILPKAGSFSIKTTWLTDRSEKNPKTDEEETSSNPNDFGFTTENESLFEFDKTTRTILSYKGKKTNLVIPKTIDNLEVKKIANRAFAGNGKEQEERLKSVTIPEGVEEIGEEAFTNNKLSEIKLPKTLVKIGENAFKGQWKNENKGLKVEIPDLVEVIESGVFESAGEPLIVTGMNGVKTIKSGAFSNNKDVEIYAPNIETIEENAFSATDSFNYAKIYTENKKLKSKQGEYLVNLAVVKINMVDAKDSEKIYKIGLKYGTKNPTLERTTNIDEFYKIGENVSVVAPKFREEGQLYVSSDEPINVLLEKETEITFKYYKNSPEIRLPIFNSDENIVGFYIPNTNLKLKVGEKEFTTITNQDGFFEFGNLKLDGIEKIEFISEENQLSEIFVNKWNGKEYIVKDNILLRYMGENKDNLVIPNSIENSPSIEEISNFAFYGKQIKNITIPDKIKTIGSGAFLNTGLNSFGWNLENINTASLRTIKEYAFKDNLIKVVKLPELTHIIQKSAFENNQIQTLELGKYTGHIGDRAFKNNQIEKIVIPKGVEEIGKEAFMNNKLKSVEFLPSFEGGHSEGIKEILADTFTNNQLKEIKLIDSIEKIHETAFNLNGDDKVKVYSENEKLKSGQNFIVIRKTEDSEKPTEDNKNETVDDNEKELDNKIDNNKVNDKNTNANKNITQDDKAVQDNKINDKQNNDKKIDVEVVEVKDSSTQKDFVLFKNKTNKTHKTNTKEKETLTENEKTENKNSKEENSKEEKSEDKKEIKTVENKNKQKTVEKEKTKEKHKENKSISKIIILSVSALILSALLYFVLKRK